MQSTSLIKAGCKQGRGIFGSSILIGLSCFALQTAQVEAATKLVVTLPNQLFIPVLGNSGTAGNQTAGAPFNITLTAVDALGNIDVLYNGTKGISYSGPGGAPNYSTNVVFTLGQATALETTLTLAETTTLTASDGFLTSDASSSLVVQPGLIAALQLLMPGEAEDPGTSAGKKGSAGPQMSGRGFTVKVNAVDSYWNRVNSTDTVALTSSDPNAVLPTNSCLDNGKANFNVTLKTAGYRTVLATNLTRPDDISAPSTVAVVGQQTQSITFNPLGNLVYGAATFGLSASTSSGLPASFSIVSGPATIDANANVSITGVGMVTVQASQAGDTNYMAATNVVQTFTVTPAALVVSALNQSRFAGQTNPMFSGSVSGLQYNDNITATFGVTATTSSAIGNYPIFPTLTDPANKLSNYSVTSSGILSINPFATQWSVANGGNGHYYQAMLAPGGISWDQASANATNAGGYLATITSSDENNFVFGLISNTADYWVPDGGGGDGVWIGGVRLGPLNAPANATNWIWVTGEPFNYQNWSYGQPNNVNGYQDHIQFYSPAGLADNKWNDAADVLDKAYVPGYVIEYETNPYATNQSSSTSVESFSSINVTAGGQATMHFSGVPNRTYTIQASGDLQNWSAIGSITAGADGQFDFADANAGNFTQRFYRTSYP